jgi:hypothetical protein
MSNITDFILFYFLKKKKLVDNSDGPNCWLKFVFRCIKRDLDKSELLTIQTVNYEG